MVVSLKRIGGSLAVIIPKAMAEGLAAGDTCELTKKPEGILLTRRGRQAKRPITEIVKGLDVKAYRRHAEALLHDNPVGKEFW